MGKDLKGKDLGKGLCQRKDGRYYARLTYQGVKIEKYGSNYQELRRLINEEKAAIDKGEENLKIYTVREWFEDWFTIYKVPTIKPQSVDPMKRKVTNTFLPLIGDIELCDLKPIDIQKAVNALLEEERIAKSSIAEGLNRLRDCFASAVNNGYMRVNPAFDIIVPFSEQRIKDDRWLSSEEISVFLGAAKGSWWYEMLYVMIHTGLRIGEVGGLKASDIHWSEGGKNGYIEVNQSLIAQYEDGIKTLRLGDLKTQNSHRKIPFLKDVEECLKRQLKKRDDLKKSLGKRYRATGEFSDCLFVSTMGSVCTRYNGEHTINSLVKQINLEESVRAAREGREPKLMSHLYPHALRHTFASLCYKAKLDPKATQSLMGHANYSTTIDIYTHFGEEDMAFDLEKFNKLELNEKESSNFLDIQRIA